MAVVLGSLFLVQVGLLLGAAFQTTSQVNTWSSMIMLLFLLPAMFGDFLTPPEPIPTLMRLIPTSYMTNTISLAMSNKATVGTVGLNLAILAASAMVAFGAVIWVLRRERQ
jgi:ABC-type multidrug transport system permease subunit